MMVLLDRETPEPALVQMPAPDAVTVRMPSGGMGHGEPLHEARQLAIGFRP
jgi:hypothetical protein